MNNQIKKVQTIAEELAINKSEEFMNLFLDLIDFFNNYFENQALEYIKNLENYPWILLKKESDLEKFIKKLENIYKLWINEEQKNINLDLNRIWKNYEDIILSNEKIIEYAKNQAWISFKQINDTTDEVINSIITNAIKDWKILKDIATEIKEKFADFTLYRSTLIATMETTMAYAEWRKAQYEEYSQKMGVTWYKRAITQKDNNVRDSHRVNERDWRIKRNQIYSWTGTMNAPHGFLCRCHDSYSLTNPKTGLLNDNLPDYTQDQIDNFDKIWGKNLNLTEKQLEKQKELKLIDQEIIALQGFSWDYFDLINSWYKNGNTDVFFQSWIQFLFWWLNKLPKYEWKVYWWIDFSKNELEKIWNLTNLDLFSTDQFIFGTTKDFKKQGNFIFEINSRKWINIKDFSKNSEVEILFLPKTLFDIQEIENNDNNFIFWLMDLW